MNRDKIETLKSRACDVITIVCLIGLAVLVPYMLAGGMRASHAIEMDLSTR